MDPWLTKDQEKETGCKESVVADLENSLSTTTNSEERNSLPISFSDNFQPFQKLPDSDEYLASLETKLKNIQNSEKKTSGELLRSLEETRESYMVNLLTDSVEVGTCANEDSFEELKINPVLKKLVPEKQAITTEELVHLLKADQLENLVANQEESIDETISTSSVAPTEETHSAPKDSLP